MIDLVVATSDFGKLDGLVGGPVEGCAVMYAAETSRADGTHRLLVRDVQLATDGDYTRRGELEAELNPVFVAAATKRARRDGTALVFVHSHPGRSEPSFSSADSEGEEHLSTFLARRHPAKHAAMVLSAGGVRARRLGGSDEIRVVRLGAHRDVLFDPTATSRETDETFDRQVRAFGALGQRAIQELRVAVVGIGGTGSLVVQQLVHLGVRNFLLIDPDVVETTNLNRVANAFAADLGTPKVDVAARYIRSVAPDAVVERIQDDIVRARIARALTSTDFIFGCTDSHGSRAVLQQVSYQYLIPCIDMGVTIATASGRVTHIYGRVQLLAPGLACFTCSSLLDSSEVRRDMMTPFERQADPYLVGEHEPAPAVMSLNGTVASIAMTMFLSAVAGVPAEARYVLYNAKAPSLRAIGAQPGENCFICSRSGSLARGDEWPLMARQD